LKIFGSVHFNIVCADTTHRFGEPTPSSNHTAVEYQENETKSSIDLFTTISQLSNSRSTTSAAGYSPSVTATSVGALATENTSMFDASAQNSTAYVDADNENNTWAEPFGTSIAEKAITFEIGVVNATTLYDTAGSSQPGNVTDVLATLTNGKETDTPSATESTVLNSNIATVMETTMTSELMSNPKMFHDTNASSSITATESILTFTESTSNSTSDDNILTNSDDRVVSTDTERYETSSGFWGRDSSENTLDEEDEYSTSLFITSNPNEEPTFQMLGTSNKTIEALPGSTIKSYSATSVEGSENHAYTSQATTDNDSETTTTVKTSGDSVSTSFYTGAPDVTATNVASAQTSPEISAETETETFSHSFSTYFSNSKGIGEQTNPSTIFVTPFNANASFPVEVSSTAAIRSDDDSVSAKTEAEIAESQPSGTGLNTVTARLATTEMSNQTFIPQITSPGPAVPTYLIDVLESAVPAETASFSTQDKVSTIPNSKNHDFPTNIISLSNSATSDYVTNHVRVDGTGIAALTSTTSEDMSDNPILTKEAEYVSTATLVESKGYQNSSSGILRLTSVDNPIATTRTDADNGQATSFSKDLVASTVPVSYKSSETNSEQTQTERTELLTAEITSGLVRSISDQVTFNNTQDHLNNDSSLTPANLPGNTALPPFNDATSVDNDKKGFASTGNSGDTEATVDSETQKGTSSMDAATTSDSTNNAHSTVLQSTNSHMRLLSSLPEEAESTTQMYLTEHSTAWNEGKQSDSNFVSDQFSFSARTVNAADNATFSKQTNVETVSTLTETLETISRQSDLTNKSTHRMTNVILTQSIEKTATTDINLNTLGSLSEHNTISHAAFGATEAEVRPMSSPLTNQADITISELNTAGSYEFDSNAANTDALSSLEMTSFQSRINEPTESLSKKIATVISQTTHPDSQTHQSALETSSGSFLPEDMSQSITDQPYKWSVLPEIVTSTVDSNAVSSAMHFNPFLNEASSQSVSTQLDADIEVVTNKTATKDYSNAPTPSSITENVDNINTAHGTRMTTSNNATDENVQWTQSTGESGVSGFVSSSSSTLHLSTKLTIANEPYKTNTMEETPSENNGMGSSTSLVANTQLHAQQTLHTSEPSTNSNSFSKAVLSDMSRESTTSISDSDTSLDNFVLPLLTASSGSTLNGTSVQSPDTSSNFHQRATILPIEKTSLMTDQFLTTAALSSNSIRKSSTDPEISSLSTSISTSLTSGGTVGTFQTLEDKSELPIERSTVVSSEIFTTNNLNPAVFVTESNAQVVSATNIGHDFTETVDTASTMSPAASITSLTKLSTMSQEQSSPWNTSVTPTLQASTRDIKANNENLTISATTGTSFTISLGLSSSRSNTVSEGKQVFKNQTSHSMLISTTTQGTPPPSSMIATLLKSTSKSAFINGSAKPFYTGPTVSSTVRGVSGNQSSNEGVMTNNPEIPAPPSSFRAGHIVIICCSIAILGLGSFLIYRYVQARADFRRGHYNVTGRAAFPTVDVLASNDASSIPEMLY